MTDTTLLHVTHAQPLPDFRLRLTFSNGTSSLADLSTHLDGPIFEPLRDPNLFAQATLDPETRTVAWPNGADLAPEFLYEIGESEEK